MYILPLILMRNMILVLDYRSKDLQIYPDYINWILMTLLILTIRCRHDLDFNWSRMLHPLVMILIGLYSNNRLDVVKYTFISGCWDLRYTSDLEGGCVDDFEDQSWLTVLPRIILFMQAYHYSSRTSRFTWKTWFIIHDIYLITILFMSL